MRLGRARRGLRAPVRATLPRVTGTSRVLAALASLAVASGLCDRAAAQERDPAAAEALFQQGRAAMDRGDLATACPKFRESNRLDPAPGTVFNLADCEEKSGRLATAWTLFQEVAQRLPSSDPRHGVAKQRAGALAPRLPRLTVRLAPSDAAGVVVRRDGVRLGAASLDSPLPLDPGTHELVVEAEGREPRRAKVELREGSSETVTLEVGLPARPSGEDTLPRDPPPGGPGPGVRSGDTPTLAWIAGGVGVAGLLLGGVAGALTLDSKSTADAECPGKRCTAAGWSAVEDGRTFATLSTIGFVVGAVGLGVGAYLWLGTDERAPARAAIVARPLPAGGSLGLEGRF